MAISGGLPRLSVIYLTMKLGWLFVLYTSCLNILRVDVVSGDQLLRPEGYFSNLTSNVILSDPVIFTPGYLLAFSFRTCMAPAQILTQQTNSQEEGTMKLLLTQEGSLSLTLHFGQDFGEQTMEVGGGLADGAWHTARLVVTADGDAICLSVDYLNTQIECHSLSPESEPLENTQSIQKMRNISTLLEFANTWEKSSATVTKMVGPGFLGCIREGPALRFSAGNIVDQSDIHWGNHCPLPKTCEGFNWSAVQEGGWSDSCSCRNGGHCLPASSEESPVVPTCVCPPGFTGSTCEEQASSCSESPCLNSGQCVPKSTGGFTCDCNGSGYSGTYCETELNNCEDASSSVATCSNGGTCLTQPRGFLCECPSGFYGNTCSNRLQDITQESTNTEDVDVCQDDANSCLNGGSCQRSDTGFVCSCPVGYSGDRCQDIDSQLGRSVSLENFVAQPQPCSNRTCPPNSECREDTGAGGSTCTCVEGFTGSGDTTCLPIDACASQPCQNGGICSLESQGSSYVCDCPGGFQGADCSEAANKCSPNPCQNGGTCSESVGTDRYTCTCPEGFQGSDCEQDIDECLANPCGHGICINSAGSYNCDCEPGWNGQTCNENINECQGNPCINGTCIDLINRYRCDCQPGFTGTNCDVKIDHCANNPCLNGGQCVNSNNSFSCICSSRYMGNTCQLEFDPCASGPCANGATCVQESAERGADIEYKCNCPPGYTGLDCSTNIDDCADVQCPENHECIDLVAGYDCRCPVGYRGETCNIDINECEPAPCQNGATCLDQIGKFVCDCLPGWTGDTCAEDIDECSDNPNICNFGICQNTDGGYECYCRPGYSGSNCSFDFDECLSSPCQNGGTCGNLVNNYNCTCVPGFDGRNCEKNIDECEVDPCKNGATCIDGINSYTCSCLEGYTGTDCEVDIDDCANAPCLNTGQCIDKVNAFECNCTNTGYTGIICEEDIDECAVGPCRHNSTCNNLVNDYSCDCWPGYEGKDCETDIADCATNPCQNNASCFELSNRDLYNENTAWGLPSSIRDHFTQGFNYSNASGYLCDCPLGYTGLNCEIDIDECQVHMNPCKNGAECVDGINDYECKCLPGFTGKQCQTNIDECELYKPCQSGAECIDGIADYHCECIGNYGGKNCSVELIGCQQVSCLNGGTCVPWLIGETEHKGNCSCMPGFDGDLCEITTTFSFKGNSYVAVASNRSEGFELSLRFRTTLSNGFIAIGQGPSFFTLQLNKGRLHLHSSMLSSFEGIFIGENLNDTNWQKVYVAVNISHLTIGLNDRLQAIHPINADSANQTSFIMTFLGGSPPQSTSSLLSRDIAEYIGCIQDISVNGIKVTEKHVLNSSSSSNEIVEFNTEKGCHRKDQCAPNPCRNGGICTDLWRSYKCTCHRPFLGPSCQYNYTGATFGFENETKSQVIVDIANPQDFRLGIDLTMFIRTRKSDGIIFYLGVDPMATVKNQIIGRLVNGTLQVEATFADKVPEYFKLYSAKLDDGFRHFLRVERFRNLMSVKVNDTISIKQDLSSVLPIQAEKLYLGNFLMMDSPSTTATTPSATFSSVITTPSSIPAANDLTIQSATFSEATNVNPTTIGKLVLSSETTIADDGESFTTVSPEVNFNDIVEAPLSRKKREPILSNNAPEATVFDEVSRTLPSFFKGVIQDVQLSNGAKVNRIVKMFELDFAENVNIEDSLGTVSAIGIKKGVVSDNTCRINPCQNDGICRVTWNDYLCECKNGFKGENCNEVEYCYWNQCPEGSICRTLTDGHECIANATFNGVNNSIVYQPDLSSNLPLDSFSARFRTKTPGTILQIIGDGNYSLFHVSLTSSGNVEAKFPLDLQIANLTFGINVTDGLWHTITIRQAGGFVIGDVDGLGYEEIYLEGNNTFDLSKIIPSANIALGAGILHKGNITSEDNTEADQDSEALSEQPEFFDHFRGCIEQVRIGGILLPFYSQAELINSTVANKFVIETKEDVTTGRCVLCYEKECLNDGQCSDPQEEFECRCPPGFDGPLCGINIDECANNSCVNGDCEDLINHYVCKCDLGWVGEHCDIDEDECENEPCQNGGTCRQTPEPGDYTCDCTPEYRGKNCQDVKIKTCKEKPCENGGTCIDSPESDLSDRYTCDCPQGYEGSKCEKQSDFCVKLDVQCLNGGTCVSNFSSFSYECKCIEGFSGKNCEINVDDCLSGPCANGGKCEDLVNGFHCNCTDTGFKGPTCNVNINECLSDPCKNYGRCNDTLGDYQCHCRSRYCGKNCQRQNPCIEVDKLCLNGGECVPDCDRPPYYKCTCAPGFEGIKCDKKFSSTEDVALIVGPIVGGMAFIALVGLLIFLVMARRKRKGEGHYRPAKQELTNPRLQLDNMLKMPPEERLI